jgi:hypothetical protein
MIEAYSALLLLTEIASGWLKILTDTCVLVVLIAMLLVLTAPFWALGLIFWSLWRVGAYDNSGHSSIHGGVQRFIQNAFWRERGRCTNRRLGFFSHGLKEEEK